MPHPFVLQTTGNKLINQDTLEIIDVPSVELQLEHSLYSLSKWEMIWHEPYLQDREIFGEAMTNEQIISYLECMTINGPFDLSVYLTLNQEQVLQIKRYMEDPMTGTNIAKDPRKGPNIGGVTSTEEIYYAMFKWGIDMSCEHWHINRLMTLLNVFGEKENPKKKSKQQQMQEMYHRNLAHQARMKAKSARKP